MTDGNSFLSLSMIYQKHIFIPFQQFIELGVCESSTIIMALKFVLEKQTLQTRVHIPIFAADMVIVETHAT